MIKLFDAIISPGGSGTIRPPRTKLWCGCFLLAVALVAAETVGLPHLRVTYTYTLHGNPRHVTSGRYLGPLGWRTVYFGEHPAGCPVVLFITPEPLFSQRLIGGLKVFWTTI